MATGPKALLTLIWAGLLVVGLMGLWNRFATGHLLTDYGSYVPWGLWVALYFHGVGMAAGVFTIVASCYLFDVSAFRRLPVLRSAIVLSVAALLPALLAIGLDLGHVERGHFIFLSPGFTSVMTVNAWSYQAFLMVAAIVWLLSWKKDSGWLKSWLILGIVLCVAFAAGSGLFFGAVDVKPYWHSAIWPMVTLASAITAGGALLLCIQNHTHLVSNDANGILRWLVAGGLLVYFGLEYSQWLVNHWYAGHAASSTSADVEYNHLAWIHYAAGGMLPFVLLLIPWRTGWRIAALLVVTTFVTGRMNLILPGEPPAEMPGLVEAFHHERLSFAYHPTTMEIQVGLFLVALGMAIYFIGGRINQALVSRRMGAEQGDK